MLEHFSKLYYKKDYINHNKNKYHSIEYDKPNEKFIVLEIIGKENIKKGLKYKKGIFILKFDKKNKLSLGRGLNIDVRIPEISVSRLHANISYNNGNFFLQDNSSKYGT